MLPGGPTAPGSPSKWTKGFFVGLRALPTRWAAPTPPPGNHSGVPRLQPQLISEGWDPGLAGGVPAWTLRKRQATAPLKSSCTQGTITAFRKAEIASSLKAIKLSQRLATQSRMLQGTGWWVGADNQWTPAEPERPVRRVGATVLQGQREGQSQGEMTMRSSQALPSATHCPRTGGSFLNPTPSPLHRHRPRTHGAKGLDPRSQKDGRATAPTPSPGHHFPLDFLVFCKFPQGTPGH